MTMRAGRLTWRQCEAIRAEPGVGELGLAREPGPRFRSAPIACSGAGHADDMEQLIADVPNAMGDGLLDVACRARDANGRARRLIAAAGRRAALGIRIATTAAAAAPVLSYRLRP